MTTFVGIRLSHEMAPQTVSGLCGRTHGEQLSVFERGRIIGLKEVGGANGRITRHMGLSDEAIRKFSQEWVDSGRFRRHDGSGRSRATADQDRLNVRSAVTEHDSSL
ncbi:hypothetical protein TNCV_2181721 [Trichonephila clavipes]|uniref:Uncharacterized protein n=1 Tax=Trichonephila clavipes TaxID=2585209 RepID=A0A8X6VV11_TRICX|nr:hypothetical protein TNCV_2181721 [Trichonephila clavipes]